MAFDGVFAFQGKNHITASQLGRLVQGTAGDGRYVLPTQDRLQATMQTANKVVIGSGDLVMDGRYVTNETGAELTVESGTSGYNRNDIVALRYSKDGSTGVESFEPVVIKGAPVTGTAADPAVDAGAISDGSSEALMPLWRIPIRGLAPGTPERIATVGKTLSEIGDSVSRAVLLLSEDLAVPGGKMRVEVYDMPTIRELVMRFSGNVNSTGKFFTDYYTTGKIPKNKLPSTSVNCALAQYEGAWGRFCARGCIVDDGRARLSLIAPQAIHTGYTSECRISYAF